MRVQLWRAFWLVLVVGALFSPGFVFAAGVDYSALVEAVDFETVAAGVLGVAAALITVYIVIKGVRLVMGFVRGEEASGGGINITRAPAGYWDDGYQHGAEDQARIDRLMEDADLEKASRRM